MTIDEALTRMFGCQLTGNMPIKHVDNLSGYAAWIEGLEQLANQVGYELHWASDVDGFKRISSRKTAEDIMVRGIRHGIDPAHIVALYMFCFEA